MESSYESDTLILCSLIGFAINSFDGPSQPSVVGPVVYVLNEFIPLSYFVIRCRFVDLSIHCQQPGSCLRRSYRSSIMAKISTGTFASIAYVFQWGYDGKQPSIVSLGTTSHLSGNQVEYVGSSACVLSLTYIRSSPPSLMQLYDMPWYVHTENIFKKKGDLVKIIWYPLKMRVGCT